MQTNDPALCGKYSEGHLTHFMQTRAQRDRPRFRARVFIHSPVAVRVVTEGSDSLFFYHDALGLYFKCLTAFAENIQFEPLGSLLWIQTTGASEGIKGIYFPAYLSQTELTPCELKDKDSGFFYSPPSNQ